MTNQQVPTPSQPTGPSEDEIDLLALAKTVWINRKKVLTFTLGFMLVGLVVALLSPKEYTASSAFIPVGIHYIRLASFGIFGKAARTADVIF